MMKLLFLVLVVMSSFSAYSQDLDSKQKSLFLYKKDFNKLYRFLAKASDEQYTGYFSKLAMASDEESAAFILRDFGRPDNRAFVLKMLKKSLQRTSQNGLTAIIFPYALYACSFKTAIQEGFSEALRCWGEYFVTVLVTLEGGAAENL